jgi:hypothetical protein
MAAWSGNGGGRATGGYHPRVTTVLLAAAFVLALAGWRAHYRATAVRAVRLDFAPSPFLAALLPRVPRLQRPFAPTPWLYNRHLQLLWLVAAEALAPPLHYERSELLAMRDGGTTALDWLGLDAGSMAPTLVVLPSITGDAQSVRALVRDLRRATGWRVVACTRRGHGGLAMTVPRFNTMGSTDDLREQLAHVRAHVPSSPLYAIGVSAGSGLLARYLGEEGARSVLHAGVVYCPAYDIGVAWHRVLPFYSRLMARRLRRLFLERHASSLRHLGTYAHCLAAEDLAQFHERAHELAGCADTADYLARSNPMVVFDDVAVPTLLLNADDDPVCVARNAEENAGRLRGVPDALMARTARGSHCAFLEGAWPRSWAHALMAEYLLATHALGADRLPRP